MSIHTRRIRTTSPRTAVVVGNPKPRSRTLAAATTLARGLTDTEPDIVLDLAELGGSLFDQSAHEVSEAVESVAGADVVVVASPTYKAAYTGLLKAFMDRFPGGGLDGVLAAPLMLGAGPGHALAVETTLRPVLSELGATVPAGGLYVIDAQYDEPAVYQPWLDRARPVFDALLAAKAVV
ncbi:NADPH-dependent FMN reductase [Nocardioides insulae]|uniref:NADPH-dependent FMN reductase n=1 Tax=Nocardioides insulae TaxID=394734 RepID=UPI0004284AEA|nr:NAD(P)H-dependent oxidoreductase [Nocardioides insulae]